MREGPDYCPGYLITLPGTDETFRAYLHWDKGHDLRMRYDGQEPTAPLLDCIETLAGAIGEQEQYVLRKAKER